MKNVTKIIGLLVIISLIGIVSADEGYCFRQLTNGQSVPAQIFSETSHLSCDGTRCIVKGLSGGFLNICTDSLGNYASYIKCSKNCNYTNNGNGGASPASELNLTLSANFPFPNNGVFTKQNFFMDIHVNKISEIYLIDNIEQNQITLCSNCKDFNQSMNFNQGKNDITIRAVHGNEILTKRIVFFIDNKKPRIIKILPLANKYASGDFSVNYDEDNVKNVQLNYGLGNNIKKLDISYCSSGKNKLCTASVNLSEFDSKTISYWFVITDVANSSVSSKQTKVLVDYSSPIITNLSYKIERTGVNFKLKIIEKNLYRVYYYDNDDTKGKILCSGLSNGYCNNKINLKKGHHDIIFEVLDKAGNSAITNASLDIN